MFGDILIEKISEGTSSKKCNVVLCLQELWQWDLYEFEKIDCTILDQKSKIYNNMNILDDRMICMNPEQGKSDWCVMERKHVRE